MKVLLADDHPLFLDGLERLLSLNGVDVVGTARDGLEAVEKARALQPEAILMDIQMPRLNGLIAARLIKAEQPDVKIVMLTMSENDQDLFEAIRCGANGYLLKSDDFETFFALFTGMVQGEAPLSPGLAKRVLDEFARRGRGDDDDLDLEQDEEPFLTPRRIEVLTLVAQGLTYKEVGARLFLAEQTIKYHMGEIIKRLHLKNRRQAIEYARRMGLDGK